MPIDSPVQFGPYRLDPQAAGLFRDGKPVHLTPKAFAVLIQLVDRAGKLAGKDELLRGVWPDVVVSDASLKVCVREIRKALKDDPARPRYIDTVHRRGYRFIATVGKPAATVEILAERDAGVVGRDTDLAQLRQWWARALAGERQIVFVTGEPGIGKTTLVAAFRGGLRDNAWVARGQCFEQFGEGEPYLPVLEALGRLGRTAIGARLADVLTRHAPAWMQQLPALAGRADAVGLDQAAFGASRPRMLREFSEAIEVLTASTPLLLVLEDLHWADRSTLDLVSALARRGAPARLLLLATYRPTEASGGDLAAIRQELGLHERCRELRLGYLSESAVRDLLNRRLPQHDLPDRLARRLLRHCGGNPLFLINEIDDLVARQVIVRRDQRWSLALPLNQVGRAVPDSIRQLIARQVERLAGEEQRLLEAAAVVGVEFTSALVAELLGEPAAAVEERCARLAHREQFLKPLGAAVAHDDAVLARYGFIHALYRDVLHGRLSPARRVRLHRQAGACLARQGAAAAKLAVHFEQGRDYANTLAQLRRAADTAARRHASVEAIRHLSRGLRLAPRLRGTDQGAARLALHEQRGQALAAAGRLSEALADYEAMLAAARQLGGQREESLALFHIARMCFFLDRRRCLRVAEQSLALSRRIDDPRLKADVRFNHSHWRLSLHGCRPSDVRTYAECIQAARRADDQERLAVYVTLDALLKCYQARYRDACRGADEAARLTQATGDAYHYLCSQFFKCWALLHLGEWANLRDTLHAAEQLSTRNDNQMMATSFRIMHSWMLEEAGEFAAARQISQQVRTGPELAGLHWLGQIRMSAVELGLGLMEEAGPRLLGIRDLLAQDKYLLDWILHPLYQWQLGEYWLARGDHAAAAAAGQQLCALAACSGERTYLALGHDLQARAALLAKDVPAARSAVTRGLRSLRGGGAPLAEWRLHATAARLDPGSATAARHSEHSLAVRGQLLRSLHSGPTPDMKASAIH